MSVSTHCQCKLYVNYVSTPCLIVTLINKLQTEIAESYNNADGAVLACHLPALTAGHGPISHR